MSDADDKAGVVWFRRDLRLNNNPAWAAATSAHRQIIAVFVLEPRLMKAAGVIRRNQLLAHLHALDAQLQARGGGLVIRYGPAVTAIARLIKDCEASALYLNSDFTPFSTSRDQTIADAISVPVHSFNGLTVHEPGAVLTKKGTLSLVFTPFYRRWSITDRTPWPSDGAGRPVMASSEPIPKPEGMVPQVPGESAAWDRLTHWLELVDDYADLRDLPAVKATSGLSADLKFGTLAARSVVDAVGVETPGREAFVRQLAWRDWWAHTLAVRPDLANVALKTEYDNIAWSDDRHSFKLWCTGQTGYPIVDAGMRQLVSTGWMHNRLRMICASFLVKDLLIDWRQGERFFRHHLVDADIAQNAGNWQWVAGSGPDAAPYFRVFNPTSQATKFDPNGDYVRTWIPELARLRPPGIHNPSRATIADLQAAGVVLAKTYPKPIIDHDQARLRTLEAYKLALNQGKASS